MIKELFLSEQFSFFIGVIFKTILCVILVGFIGYNREKKGMVVGIRTHVMVGLAGLLIQLTALEYYHINGGTNDVFRLAAQYISGIGFLGAGAILKDRRNVKGLTTAASICLVAVIGLAVGAGIYFSSILITIVAYAFLNDWLKLKKIITKKKDSHAHIDVDIKGNVREIVDTIKDMLRAFGVEIQSIEVRKEGLNAANLRLKISIDDEIDINDILSDMISLDVINKVELVEH